jgi:hypothetical protein
VGGRSVKFTQGPTAGIAFPGPIWKQGDHWNFIGQGSLFSSATNKFDTWTRKDGPDGTKVMASLGGGGENSGQWMMPVPKQVDGSLPPSGAGAPNILINTKGGDRYVFATWDNVTESLTPWTAPQGAPPTGQVAELEKGRASWWGASGGTDNNGRMMMIGWATVSLTQAAASIDWCLIARDSKPCLCAPQSCSLIITEPQDRASDSSRD